MKGNYGLWKRSNILLTKHTILLSILRKSVEFDQPGNGGRHTSVDRRSLPFITVALL